ncbi:hypothetical protein I553_3929 [Mycobacterium xenopi 4042]|uniref:Uncharacterized protein n=1 Tax=Mycobacterium xenopi 4042 TaxID=1299334 RepID=X8DJ95_MYCXE|nr:hypothetical protein I553_3929 [Mycobacterium xenopi 4042]
MKLDELEIAHRDTGRSASATPSPVEPSGLVVTIEMPEPTVARSPTARARRRVRRD